MKAREKAGETWGVMLRDSGWKIGQEVRKALRRGERLFLVGRRKRKVSAGDER